jgi:hypothetical protein
MGEYRSLLEGIWEYRRRYKTRNAVQNEERVWFWCGEALGVAEVVAMVDVWS